MKPIGQPELHRSRRRCFFWSGRADLKTARSWWLWSVKRYKKSGIVRKSLPVEVIFYQTWWLNMVLNGSSLFETFGFRSPFPDANEHPTRTSHTSHQGSPEGLLFVWYIYLICTENTKFLDSQNLSAIIFNFSFPLEDWAGDPPWMPAFFWTRQPAKWPESRASTSIFLVKLLPNPFRMAKTMQNPISVPNKNDTFFIKHVYSPH